MPYSAPLVPRSAPIIIRLQVFGERSSPPNWVLTKMQRRPCGIRGLRKAKLRGIGFVPQNRRCSVGRTPGCPLGPARLPLEPPSCADQGVGAQARGPAPQRRIGFFRHFCSIIFIRVGDRPPVIRWFVPSIKLAPVQGGLIEAIRNSPEIGFVPPEKGHRRFETTAPSPLRGDPRSRLGRGTVRLQALAAGGRPKIGFVPCEEFVSCQGRPLVEKIRKTLEIGSVLPDLQEAEIGFVF